jgi:hypothetical protein
MSDTPKTRPMELSRRTILRNLAFTTAAGVAALGTVTIGTRQAAAQSKASQKAVGYQDTPKGAQQCDNCRQFAAPTSCKVVEGTIAAAGWCKMYVKTPA